MDPRNIKLAKTLVNYSISLKKYEKVLIEASGFECIELVEAIVKEIYNIGGVPYVNYNNATIQRSLLMEITESQARLKADYDEKFMYEMDAYIAIRDDNNIFQITDVPVENINIFTKATELLSKTRLRKKWVVIYYPSPSMAQSAKKSTSAFKEFYYKMCNLDYSKMDSAQNVLKTIMENTDFIRIVGPGTDLQFSIKDIPVVKCSGKHNIPDGEIFTSPVKNSVFGYITYNLPSIKNGFLFEGIRLDFKDGKIIKSTANDTERISKIFEIDEGARYIGEFAIGLNPYINDPIHNILFDEKITGSFHFNPGRASEDAFNGNISALSWDLVSIQTPKYGGGEIYFDNKLIRKDGRFVLEELFALNPENLA